MATQQELEEKIKQLEDENHRLQVKQLLDNEITKTISIRLPFVAYIGLQDRAREFKQKLATMVTEILCEQPCVRNAIEKKLKNLK